MIAPDPWQREHGCEIENSPCPWDSMPRPWHFGHTFGDVPGLAPVPRQVGQVCVVATLSGICAPVIACSKLIATDDSRSLPRSARGPLAAPPPARAPPGPPFSPPKRLERMSWKPPKSAALKPPLGPLPEPPCPPP